MQDDQDDTEMGQEDSKRTSLTPADLEEISAAHRRAEISAQREKMLHGMELRLAELIGVDGDGGEFESLKRQFVDLSEKHRAMDDRIKPIELFTHKAKWTIGLLATGGGVVAAVAMKIVDHLIK